jgi:tRNA(fMet)-specific endonuclease VapC
MGSLIDSSVLVAAGRGLLDLEATAAKLHEEDVAIAAITAAELLHGVHRSPSAATRGKREAFVERVLAALPVLSFDAVVARAHSRLLAQVTGAGLTVGAHDLLIASTAVAHDRRIITRDERSLGRIAGVDLLRI